MPYNPTAWVDGTTMGNQTRMNNLETQYTEATNSFEQDILSAFVHSGLAVTRHNSYSAAVLADSPLRYYRLDETGGTNAYDSSGNGQNGTLNGGYTQNVTGALKGDPDTALTLNGSTGYVSLPTTGLPTGNPGSGFTLEAWVKPAAVPGAGFAAFLGFGTAGTNNQAVNLGFDTTGKPWVSVWGTNAQSASALTVGTWYHLVGVYDGAGHINLYVNGALAAGPVAVTPNIVLGTATIGQSGRSAEWFNGTVDEAAIYNTALSSTRISAHYTAGTSFTTQVDLSSGVAFPLQADNTLRRRAIAGASFTTVTPSTTYYLYAQPDGTTYWSTANAPAANSLALAQVTTDGSGNVATWTDKRPLTTTLLPAATMGVFPRVVAQVLGVHVTATGAQTLLSYTTPAGAPGLYRVGGWMRYGQVGAQTVTFFVGYSDPVTASGQSSYFVTTETTPRAVAAISLATPIALACLPATLWAAGGTSIVVIYSDGGGTPNDYVSALIERIA